MEIKSAVLAALSYFDLFSYPLSEEEVFFWLPAKAGRQEVKKVLEELKKAGKVSVKDGFYFFPPKNSVELRKKRERYAEGKIKKAQKAARLLGFLPGVLLVGLTGNLAMKAAKKEDDIDFLIITRSGWLWRSRFLAIFLLELLGWRRRPNQKEARDKICLNLFIEEGHLALEKERHDLYTAHELLQMKPLVDKASVYQRFLQANSWAVSFLPQAWEKSKVKSQSANWRTKVKSKEGKEVAAASPTIVEKILAGFQLKKISAHQSREEILPGQLFFHPQDRRGEMMRKYRKMMENKKSQSAKCRD